MKLQSRAIKDIDMMFKHYFEKYNLDGWEWKVNKRLKRVLGRCWAGEKKLIELSYEHITFSKVEAIEDTILHELAHAIDGCKHGHREEWQKLAVELGCVPSAGKERVIERDELNSHIALTKYYLKYDHPTKGTIKTEISARRYNKHLQHGASRVKFTKYPSSLGKCYITKEVL